MTFELLSYIMWIANAYYNVTLSVISRDKLFHLHKNIITFQDVVEPIFWFVDLVKFVIVHVSDNHVTRFNITQGRESFA